MEQWGKKALDFLRPAGWSWMSKEEEEGQFSKLPKAKPSRQLHLVVHDHVAVLVFDSEPPGRVAGLLPAVGIDRLHRAVWILPLLVLSGVDLLLASVEVDLLVSVPEEESEGDTECL